MDMGMGRVAVSMGVSHMSVGEVWHMCVGSVVEAMVVVVVMVMIRRGQRLPMVVVVVVILMTRSTALGGAAVVLVGRALPVHLGSRGLCSD